MKKKENASHVKQTRLLRLEALEARQLLSATAYDFSAAGGGDNVRVVQVSHAAIPETIELTDSSLELAAAEAKSTVVTTLDDVVNATDNKISLREAISYASSGDTITFNLSGSNRTIRLAQGNNALVVNKSITIDGGSSGIRVSAVNNSRAFRVTGSNVVFNNVNITRGSFAGNGGGVVVAENCKLTLNNCQVYDNTATNGKGGGIYVNSLGELIANNSKFFNNTVTGSDSYGGGICADLEASIKLNNCQVYDNTSSGHGGGIAGLSAFVYINNGSVYSNTTVLNGGGIYGSWSSLDLSGVSIYNNKATNTTSDRSQGGGVAAIQTDLTIDRCRIYGNVADNTGGGVYAYGPYDCEITATNTLLYGNQGTHGSAWLSDHVNDTGAPLLTFKNVTIANNTSTSTSDGGAAFYVLDGTVANLYNTIVAGNVGAQVAKNNATINAYNTLSSYTNWSGGSSNYVYDSSKPLFTNAGGGDFTLPNASQAINRGANSYVSGQFDLAGNTRIIGGAVDLGAFENTSNIAKLATPTITTTSTTTSTITVNWGAIAHASGYVVEYKKASDSTFQPMPQTNQTSYTIPGLAANTTYDVRVVAKGNGTNYSDSDPSAVKAVKTKAEPVQLAAPTWKSSSSTASSITLNWNDVDHASGYVVVYKLSSDSVWTEADPTTSTSTSTSFTINGLEPSTEYKFKVLAKGDGTNYTDSVYSSIKLVKTKPGSVQPVQLDAPTWKSSSSTTTSITLNWNDVDHASEYVVAYKLSSDSVWTEADPTPSTSFTINDLEPDTTYKFKVLAKGDGTNYTDSVYSSIKAVKTKPAPAPATPLDAPIWKSSSSTDVSATIAWNAVANASSYRVEYKGPTDSGWTEANSTTSTTSTINGLAPETTYKFRVCAVGDDVNYSDSVYSSIKAVKTKPASTTVTINYNPATHRANVSWPAISGAVTYKVQFSKNNGETWPNYKTGLTTTSCEAAGVYAGYAYGFRIYGVDANGKVLPNFHEKMFAPIELTSPAAEYEVNSSITVALKAADSTSATIRWYSVTDNGNVEIAAARNQLTYTPTTGDYDVKVVATGTGDSEGCVSEVTIARPAVTVDYDPATHRANVSWSPIPGAVTYKVQFSKNNGETWPNYKTGLTTTSCEAVGVYAGSAYGFRIYGVDANGATLERRHEKMFAPIELTSSVTMYAVNSAINVSLKGAGSASATVRWYNATPSGDVEIVAARGSLTYVPTTADYDVRVVATGTGVSSGSFSELTFTKPSVSIAYDAATRKAIVVWPAIPGAATYKVQFSKNNGETWPNYKTGLMTTSCEAVGLYTGKTYGFRIYGVDINGTVLPGSYETFYTPGAAATAVLDEAFADFFEDALFDEI